MDRYARRETVGQVHMHRWTHTEGERGERWREREMESRERERIGTLRSRGSFRPIVGLPISQDRDPATARSPAFWPFISADKLCFLFGLSAWNCPQWGLQSPGETIRVALPPFPTTRQDREESSCKEVPLFSGSFVRPAFSSLRVFHKHFSRGPRVASRENRECLVSFEFQIILRILQYLGHTYIKNYPLFI